MWHLLIRQIRASAETGCDVDFSQLAFGSGERAKRRVVRATGILHHDSRQTAEHINAVGHVPIGKPLRFLISRFQVKVHHLLLQRSTGSRDALVEKQLVLDLRDG